MEDQRVGIRGSKVAVVCYDEGLRVLRPKYDEWRASVCRIGEDRPASQVHIVYILVDVSNVGHSLKVLLVRISVTRREEEIGEMEILFSPDPRILHSRPLR